MYKTLMPVVLVMLIALLATVALAASPPTILVGTGTAYTSVEKAALPSQAAVPVALKSEAGTVAYQGYTEPTKKMAADTDVGTEISRIATQAYIPDKWITVAYTFTRAADFTLTAAQSAPWTTAAPARTKLAMPMPVGLTTSTVAMSAANTLC